MENPTIQELFDLKGKVALVTGCRNLGYDASKTLAELGAIVYLTRRNKEDAQDSAKKLAGENKTIARGRALDATDENNWKDIVEEIILEFGKIDILINNAGGRKVQMDNENISDDISHICLEGRSLKDWEYGINVNLTSVFLGCKAVVPHMKEKRYGKIINISSIDGILGRDLRIYQDTGLLPSVPDYMASKAGVINLTRGLAVSLAQFGIYVNSLSLGGFRRNQPVKFISNYEDRVPLGRMGRDGVDIKGAIAFLASSASDYVVGHNLVVDGGWTAW